MELRNKYILFNNTISRLRKSFLLNQDLDVVGYKLLLDLLNDDLFYCKLFSSYNFKSLVNYVPSSFLIMRYDDLMKRGYLKNE